MKKQNGITLISLIITIIVMLILAGVALSMVMGDGSMVNQAATAKDNTRAGMIQEQIGIALNKNKIAEYEGNSITKEELISSLLNEKLITAEEAEKLDNGDEIVVGGTTIDFSMLEDDGFDYLGRKYYFIGNNGYTYFNEGEDMIIYDNEGNIQLQIPAVCITYNQNLVTLSGTGDYDGDFKFVENDHLVYAVDENGKGSLFAFDNSSYCTHVKRTDLNGIEDETIYWRYFCDENNNELALRDIENISEFDNYTFICGKCCTELEFVHNGNYLYLYNSNMEPQIFNGEQISGKCVDIWDEDVSGWTAVPFDSAITDGLLTSVNGKPIKILYFYNNMYVPKTTKCISVYGTSFHIEENNVPTDYVITYEGTKEQFKQITEYTNSTRSFYDIMKTSSNNDSTILSFVVKCQDGDLVIK